MACTSYGTRTTLRVGLIGILLVLGACTDDPSFPLERGTAHDTGGPARYVYPIEGVSGTACRSGYIGDGAGGCIYAPTVEDDWGSGGGGGTSGTSGSGGGTTSAPPPDTCPAATDSTCLRPLTATDRNTIRNALNRYVRPASEFTNTAARDACRRILDEFNALLTGGDVFRGAYDTGHFGSTYRGDIHFDPRWLSAAAAGNTAALEEIAVTAFHETLHALDYSHGAATWVGGVDHYYDPMFVYLNPGSNSCVKR